MNYKYASLALLTAMAIFYVSSLQDGPLWGNGGWSGHIISNLVHIPVYALLTLLWLKGFAGTQNTGKFHPVIAFILIGLIIFAVLDEIHQSFIPGRTASFMDLGLDLLGIVCGLAAFKRFGMLSDFQQK